MVSSNFNRSEWNCPLCTGIYKAIFLYDNAHMKNVSERVNLMEIKNCAAIVTGGASGMGAATARRLSRLGAKVALLDLNKEAAEKIADRN